jgi:hypothetical protein
LARKLGHRWSVLAAASGLSLLLAGVGLGETVALSVSPPLIELSMAQGGDRSFDITLTNDGDRPFKAQAQMADLTLNQAGDPIPAPPGSGKWSVAPWVSVQDQEIEVQPGEQKRVRCRVRVPRGQSGGRYGALLFAAQRESELTASGMRIETRTGPVLMVTVARTERRRAEVTDVKLAAGDGTDVMVTAALRNTGNVHFRAVGEIMIRDSAKRVVGRLKLDGGTGTVLPDGVRDFTARWNSKRAGAGRYQAEARFRGAGLAMVNRTVEFVLPLATARASGKSDGDTK